jgi:hypothetical protein
VDIDLKDPATVDFGEIQERDMRMLATSLGVPVELLNHGSDGLGSGMPAELRKDLLALQNEADRRRFSEQFVEEFLRPIVRQYSPFDHTQEMHVTFEPFLDDKTDMADLISSVGDYMTANEARDRMGLSKLDDEEMGESFQTPAKQEAPDDQQPEGGLFGSAAEKAVDSVLENRDLSKLRALQEDFDASLFELVATEEQEDFETGARLGIGIDFPNSGVYVDWNIDAWPEEERLDGPHVSEYATLDDAQKVAQGDVRELSANDLAEGGTDFSDVNTDGWETELLDLHERVWAEDGGKELLQFTETQTPEFVKQRLRDALMGDALFEQIDSISGGARHELRTTLMESLEDDGWTIDGITEDIQNVANIDRQKAETIARSEVASTVNTARAEGYKETGMVEGETFYWTGSLDDRTTDACRWLINKTNPDHGGEPVSLETLQDLIEEAPTHDDDMQDDLARPDNFLVHPSERKTYVRDV